MISCSTVLLFYSSKSTTYEGGVQTLYSPITRLFVTQNSSSLSLDLSHFNPQSMDANIICFAGYFAYFGVPSPNTMVPSFLRTLSIVSRTIS